MSVRDNIAYGLRMRGVPAAQREERVTRALEMVKLEQLGARVAAAALGRTAAAGGARAGAGQPPARPAARRATRRARPQAPQGDAARAQAPPDGSRHHLRVRDARSGGGAHDERPDRAHAAGADRADRHAPRAVRPARARATSPTSSATPTCWPATVVESAGGVTALRVGDVALRGLSDGALAGGSGGLADRAPRGDPADRRPRGPRGAEHRRRHRGRRGLRRLGAPGARDPAGRPAPGGQRALRHARADWARR